MENVRERVRLLREFISSIREISLTELDSRFNVTSVEPQFKELFELFFLVERKDLTHEKDGAVFMLGPVFLDELSREAITQKIDRMSLSVPVRKKFFSMISVIPVISLFRLYNYGIMLHRAVFQENITVNDFRFSGPEIRLNVAEQHMLESGRLHELEKNILSLVREGNLGRKEEFNRLIKTSPLLGESAADYFRKAKNTVITFTVLCAGAAMDGGLSPSTAYYLREYYIEEVEKTRDIITLTKLSEEMLTDFIRRVHQTRIDTGVSPQIKECCDYICLHICEKLQPKELAARYGYSEAYFSTRFKRETGVSPGEYITQKKMDKACELLLHSQLDIPEIADQLGYGSQSYFGDVFRKKRGISPGEYRKSGGISKNSEKNR